jgi:hypothetical protein
MHKTLATAIVDRLLHHAHVCQATASASAKPSGIRTLWRTRRKVGGRPRRYLRRLVLGAAGAVVWSGDPGHNDRARWMPPCVVRRGSVGSVGIGRNRFDHAVGTVTSNGKRLVT